MTPLQRLEEEILRQVEGLTLRPTLGRVCRLGGLLAEAKALVPYGDWTPWVRRVGLSLRTSQLYVQAFAHAEEAQYISSTKRMTLVDFLAHIRRAKQAAARAIIADRRQQALVAPDRHGGRYRVVRRDCRAYRWPADLDAVVTDPPWRDLDAYRWLAPFAFQHLKSGGLLLLQCGTCDLPAV